jgi:hypothetical protein
MQTFSINGAAETLERDRRTITRALRHVKPDDFVRKQARWRMKTILGALEASAPKQQQRCDDDVDGLEQECQAAMAKWDREFAKLQKLPTLQERRARSIEPWRPRRCSHCRDERAR